MAVTITDFRRADDFAWWVRYASDRTPPVEFRVVLMGRTIETFTSSDGTGESVIPASPGEDPFFEILDKACSKPAIAFPGRFTLQWLAVAGALSYRVEELVSAVWTLRQSIVAGRRGVFQWETRWLEDQVSHQFRIIPVDAAGNQAATPLAFTKKMIRHPPAPNVVAGYNGAGTPTVTWSAAT